MADANSAEEATALLDAADGRSQRGTSGPAAVGPIPSDPPSFFSPKVELVDPVFRLLWSVTLLFVEGAIGLSYAVYLVTLSYLASNCGVSATSLGALYVTRGIMSLLGSLSAAPLFQRLSGGFLLLIAIAVNGAVMAWTPSISSLAVLHVAYGLSGFTCSLSDTGAQIVLRTMWGHGAGPWLTGLSITFGAFGAMVPVLSIASDDQAWAMYYTITALCIMLALTTALLHLLELCMIKRHQVPCTSPWRGDGGDKREAEMRSQVMAFDMYTYRVQLVFAALEGLSVGAFSAAVAYMTSYVEDTDSIPTSDASLLLVCIYIAATMGRVVSLVNQTFLETLALFIITTGAYVAAAGGIVIVLLWYRSGWALWLGASLFGLCVGPTTGLILDLNNRLTAFSELGTALPMVGLNLGNAVLPYLTSLIWDSWGGGPLSFLWCLVVYVGLCPLMLQTTLCMVPKRVCGVV